MSFETTFRNMALDKESKARVLATTSKWVIPGAAVAALILVITVPMVVILRSSNSDTSISVAFLGNSMQYYNDFPRFMEVISGDYVKQNSCMHTDSTLANLLQTGNGMYKKFNTTNALIEDVGFHDYGACTSQQLVFGYDRYLYHNWLYLNESSSFEGSYTGPTNDGLNPCFEDEDYKKFITNYFLDHSLEWDFIFMNDGLQSPARYKQRQSSLLALENTYVGWFSKTGAIPVFLHTHAFWSSFQDMDGLTDIPQFTSLTYAGYRQYAELLGSYLPPEQQPRIAPVGIAFLVVWEEDSAMWEKLFHYDDIHASPHGTFLQGCVVHYTLFGRMPESELVLQEDISQLFSRARRMQPPTHHRKSFPTQEEATYLYDVAKRVSEDGYLPSSFVEYTNGESASTDEDYINS